MQLEVDRSRFKEIPRFGLFTEDHDALREAVRDFVGNELRPHAEEWERAGEFPVHAVFREAGKMGLFGAKYEEAYGGTGPDEYQWKNVRNFEFKILLLFFITNGYFL